MPHILIRRVKNYSPVSSSLCKVWSQILDAWESDLAPRAHFYTRRWFQRPRFLSLASVQRARLRTGGRTQLLNKNRLCSVDLGFDFAKYWWSWRGAKANKFFLAIFGNSDGHKMLKFCSLC